VDIPETAVKSIQEHELNEDEKMVLSELLDIKRQTDKFWGM